MRRTLRHVSLIGGATMLLVPQIAMGGFLDVFDFTPSPPIYDRPFAIGTAGSTVQLDLQIKKRTIRVELHRDICLRERCRAQECA